MYLLAVGIIKHGVHDILCQLSLVWVCCSANPCIHNTLVVCTLKWHLEEVGGWGIDNSWCHNQVLKKQHWHYHF